ncbi:MAG: DUF262 domain-containing protein [Chloroflexi bacterium]|nr:DUF262 domain-containing protein [Chloroflexota bacterium]MBI3338844.1 DUF262 domain-containing protein [Chloroflexota bacterium]
MENEETQVIDSSEEETLDFTYSITSYGADYPVDSLVNRLRDNKIRVPSFQRGYVWSEKQASRFIESLLLGLPVPGIFLSKDTDSADLLVIDGQQRLKSLQFFYEGHIGEKVFKLKDVQERFVGKTYKGLEADDRQRLDDSIIHATVVKQDEPSEDHSSIYLVFERLNTGGLQLQPQEIRSAIYIGEFAELIKKLNDYPKWRNVYGNKSTRLKDQEFILRFLSMYFYRDQYEKPLKGFMNKYMAKNKNLKLHSEEILTDVFTKTIDYIDDVLGKKAFRPFRAMNASIYDSVMVGIAERLFRKSKLPDKDNFLKAYDNLLANEEYSQATSAGTSDEPVVTRRMNMAIDAFANL